MVTIQVPLPTSSINFTIEGRQYRILEYAKDKWPNRLKAKAIADATKGAIELTLQRAREIMNDPVSKSEFERRVTRYKWGYISDPASEENGRAAILGHSVGCNGIAILYNLTTPAPVVILEIIDSKAAEPLVNEATSRFASLTLLFRN